MSKFVTEKVDVIRASQNVEQLFIDGIGQLDSFEERLKGTVNIKEYPQLLKYVEHFANGHSVGPKVKYLKDFTLGVKEFEFITKHLRLYVIQQPGKKLIIFGGIKQKQIVQTTLQFFETLRKHISNQ